MNKKIIFLLGVIIIILVALTIFKNINNKKYEGYWCNYEEKSSIVVLLERDHTSKQDEKILKQIEEFQNVISSSYYSREDYEEQLGTDPDIYDTYVIIFSSLDSITTYIEELEKLPGVHSATQNTAKTNITLYNIKSHGEFTLTDSDEASENDLIEGKYKIKNGVITFTPNDKKLSKKMLYIKDNHLCGDANCTKIFAASNSTCNAN